MKKVCRDCHFLSSRVRDPYGSGETNPWNQEERDLMVIDDNDDGFCLWTEAYKPLCQKGVWIAKSDPCTADELKGQLEKERHERCYFFPYDEGMSFNTAGDLQRVHNENYQLKKSYRYTQYGLWIAACTGIGALVVQIWRLLTTSPPIPPP